MTTEQQLHLAERAHANAQRRAREELLNSVDAHVRKQLAHAECIFSPEAHAVLRRVLPMTATQIGTTGASNLLGFRFVTTGRPQRVLEQLQLLPSAHDFSSGILVLPGVEMITYGAITQCVPTYPVFRLRFGEARRILSGAWRPKSDFSGAFAEDFSAGVLVDSYAEYPAEDVGPDECTYEVAWWAV